MTGLLACCLCSHHVVRALPANGPLMKAASLLYAPCLLAAHKS